MRRFSVAPYAPLDPNDEREWCVLELPVDGDPYGEGRVESAHFSRREAEDALAAVQQ